MSPKMAAYQARLAVARAQKWADERSILWDDDRRLLEDLNMLAKYVQERADGER